jgi:hypothetical protein
VELAETAMKVFPPAKAIKELSRIPENIVLQDIWIAGPEPRGFLDLRHKEPEDLGLKGSNPVDPDLFDAFSHSFYSTSILG